jgi:hypothetical protein
MSTPALASCYSVYANSLPHFGACLARFFTQLLHRLTASLPGFSVRVTRLSDVDALFIAVIALFLLLTLGLVAGCAALEQRR